MSSHSLTYNMSGTQEHHQNPDYHVGTASLNGEHGQQEPPPQYNGSIQQDYSPPPGPPPAATQGDHAPSKPPRPEQEQSQAYVAQQPPPVHPSVSQSPASGGGDQGETKSGKTGWRKKLYTWSTKAGAPINKLTNRLGSEAFWPTSLNAECDKAARILKSFCKDGFYTEDKAAVAEATETPSSSPRPTASPGPKGKAKVLVKIPQKVIETAAGLAIFTTMRTGLHLSGAGGSGVLVSRLPDGSWSPPSGFLVHTLGAGFMIGVDIYDCVCVLRTPQAVRAFTNPRVSLGGEVGLVAGPVGAGASVEAALHKPTKPAWSYMKSRGFYAGVQADGTIILSRPDANGEFYGVKGIKVSDILQGNIPAKGPPGMWPEGAKQLFEVLKSAEGSGDVDDGVMREVGTGPTPGDLGLDEESQVIEAPTLDEKQTWKD
ncbi:hypothetical protein SLS53_008761 [Cytospora paraplurivora]|uniref:Ysc84 actin-binding domain-containing protein n=1 Tax=Cytospora paraplurivora TaxID=2898453 RepID=A0AAN9U566_9PEZI